MEDSFSTNHCISFCHISTWISHRYTHVPSLLSLSPTSHPIPLLSRVREHQVWAPVCHTANSLWLSILHLVVYMFPCYSLDSQKKSVIILKFNSSHQGPAPQLSFDNFYFLFKNKFLIFSRILNAIWKSEKKSCSAILQLLF